MSTPARVPDGEQIQAALRALADRWRDYQGGERAEAQSFLNELIDCYGVQRRAAGMRFEHHLPGGGFADMFWPGRALVEMKAPSRSQNLEEAQPQAERYWRDSEAPDGSYDAVRYIVLCSFHRILVWDMRRPSRPSANLTLDELPDHYEALQFFAAEDLDASFIEHHRQLTSDAAGAMANLYQSLKDRNAAPLDEIQRFTMQCVWTLFAEDLGMITGYPLQTIVQGLRRYPDRSSAAELGFLFRILNQKGSHNRIGHLAGTRYVNGDLFREPAEVNLVPDEVKLLAEAAEYDWRRVDPTIFGSLMEGVLGRQRRWELGAHYTHEVDILKIVEPTIVRPWRERIDATKTPSEARELLDELCAFRVLDPACGCGNFLYVAYRELRSLEAELKQRIRTLAADQGLPLPPRPWPYVPLANMQGIDIERVAVLIARVTLWMGHRQMIDLYGEAEAPLPLVDLSGIQAADALRVAWPETDCIIGNPPFLGSQNVRAAFGDDYLAWLTDAYGIGVKDFCVYWFRRAHQHLRPGQRAGLVGTNSVSQNRARSASLDYIVANGGTITDAISSQKWPGDAKVHVSLVNWVKAMTINGPRFLDGSEVAAIGPDLRAAGITAGQVAGLPQNANRCFQGPIPVGTGFILSEAEALSLISDSTAPYADVVRRYLVGEDIVTDPAQQPSRWIIDFGLRPLEEARQYRRALEVVQQRVRPAREGNPRELYRRRWWAFGERREAMRQALAPLDRYIAGTATGKRLLLTWVDNATTPSNLTNVFAFDDDFSMGVLISRAHGAWAWYRSSTLKGDLRYTPTTVFATFPWPDTAADTARDRVAELTRQLLARRTEICLSENFGLTKLYNAVDDGAYQDVKALHRELDEAVAQCYGWPRRVAQDDAALVERLRELNQQIASGQREYHPFD